MNETAQIVIVAVITVLTIVLTLVGVQIVLVLQELKKTLSKANIIIDETRSITSRFAHSTDSMSGLFMGVKTALSLFGKLKRKND